MTWWPGRRKRPTPSAPRSGCHGGWTTSVHEGPGAPGAQMRRPPARLAHFPATIETAGETNHAVRPWAHGLSPNRLVCPNTSPVAFGCPGPRFSAVDFVAVRPKSHRRYGADAVGPLRRPRSVALGDVCRRLSDALVERLRPAIGARMGVATAFGRRIVALDTGERRRSPARAGLLATNRPQEGAFSPTVAIETSRCP